MLPRKERIARNRGKEGRVLGRCYPEKKELHGIGVRKGRLEENLPCKSGFEIGIPMSCSNEICHLIGWQFFQGKALDLWDGYGIV